MFISPKRITRLITINRKWSLCPKGRKRGGS
jgi:hypothetical protein